MDIQQGVSFEGSSQIGAIAGRHGEKRYSADEYKRVNAIY